MANILVVEDDPDIADVVSSILAANGHGVRVARDGQEGLDTIAEERPDLALVDVEMPVLDGPHMVHRLQVRDAGDERIPVILFSAVPELRQLADTWGIPYVLAKPPRIVALVTIVEHALVERRAPTRV